MDYNKTTALVKKNDTLIGKIKEKIFRVFHFKNYEKLYSTEIINPSIYSLNFPQHSEDYNELIEARKEEMESRKKLEKEFGIPFEKILNQYDIDISNDFTEENIFPNETDFEDEELNIDELDVLIKDLDSYNDVVKKINSGEITANQLSMSDLLKVNLMLKEEFDIKSKNINTQ